MSQKLQNLKNGVQILLLKIKNYISQNKLFSLVLSVLFLNLLGTICLYTKLNKQTQAFNKYQPQAFEQLKTVAGVVNTNRKIYIYNPEQIVAASPVINELKTKYVNDLTALNTEVEKAQKKIKDSKNKKEDLTESYLKSLADKRNQLVSDYQTKLNIISQKINQALDVVMKANKIAAVFDSKAVLGRSENVIDITEVVSRNFQVLIMQP